MATPNRANKFSAAFVRTWNELNQTSEGRIFLHEELEIMEHLRLEIKSTTMDTISFDDYRNYFMWYTSHTDYIDPDEFIPGLTSEVAERAGFSEFHDLDFPMNFHMSFHHSAGHLYYREDSIPPGLKESFLANRKRWIDAFVKVNHETQTLPPISEFTVAADEESLSYDQTTIDLIAPLIVGKDIEEAIRILFPVTEEGLENLINQGLPFDTEEVQRSIRFIGLVEANLEVPLRVVRLSEKSYVPTDEDDESAPHKVKVVKRDEAKWWSMVPFLLLEAECSVNLIEDLVDEGFFDL